MLNHWVPITGETYLTLPLLILLDKFESKNIEATDRKYPNRSI